PGCAVAEAVARGELSAERFESCRKLQREIEAAERKRDHAAAARERQKWKTIHKALRARSKVEPKPKRSPSIPGRLEERRRVAGPDLRVDLGAARAITYRSATPAGVEPMSTIRLHRVLRATPERVYRAFIDPDAMAKWLPPNGFTGKVHHIEAEVGGT